MEEFNMEYVPLWLRDAEKVGERKSNLKTAKILLRMGLDIGKIAEATGLKKEEIESLNSKPH